MAKYSFSGSPAFVEAAAQQVGHFEAAGPARQIAALSALTNLCAQAVDAAPEHVPAILAHATEFRNQIQVALRAAELMLAEVTAARGLPEASPDQRPSSRGGSRGPSIHPKSRPETSSRS